MADMTRRDFARFSAVVAIAGVGGRRSAQVDALSSEFLLDLSLDVQPGHEIGSGGVGRLVVPVTGGLFAGPRLKGRITTPGGDWIVQRADGSRLLDVRLLMETDDGQTLYVSWRGIAYTAPSGALHARILPLFETGAPKYAWLNDVVAVGVYRPGAGKIAYRIYEIL